jgi:hypothetical protein
MKTIMIVLLVLSVILTILAVVQFNKYGTCASDRQEGFRVKEEPNALLSLVGSLKRINGYLTDPKMWSERIEMMYMDPVALARRELTKSSKK